MFDRKVNFLCVLMLIDLLPFYAIIHLKVGVYMRKILDKMFANKKLSLIIPMAIALLMYLLFVFFGTSADKTNLINFLSELEHGVPKSDIQIKRAYEISI